MPAEGGQGGTMGKLKGIGVMSIHAWALNGIVRKCTVQPMINKTQIDPKHRISKNRQKQDPNKFGSLLIPVSKILNK